MTTHAAVPRQVDSAELVERWRAGRSALFVGPAGGLLAEGCVHECHDADPDAVGRLLRDVEADGGPDAGSAPVAVGALSFDPAGPARLVVPESVRRAGPRTRAPRRVPQPGSVARLRGDVRAHPDPAGYEAMVAEALKRMADGELEKVVLARALDLTASAPMDTSAMLRELATRDPGGYLFAVGLPTSGPGPRTLLGASPELLVERRGTTVTAKPLAGSAPRHSDRTRDERAGRDLLASSKDRLEHALVVDAIAEALRPVCTRLEVPPSPSLVATTTVWHLSTRIRAEVDPAVSSLALARLLHPTPAVCGVPTAAARRAITEIEPFDRDFYLGTVGWTDARGDGEWVVSLRCCQVEGTAVRLWAGAGIVPGSVPADELRETAIKLRPGLRALGLHDDL